MEKRYDAFISYSHKADVRLARRLESQLERFAKPWYRWRSLSVFRDETSLTATPDLWPEIATRLAGSKYMILLSSPAAAESKWVRKEICFWVSDGMCEEPAELTPDQVCEKKISKLILVRTAGEAKWDDLANEFEPSRTSAFPRILNGLFSNEPYWLDLSWARNASDDEIDRASQPFFNVLAKLSARIRNLELELLVSRDLREHKKSMWILTWLLVGAVVGFVLASGAAYVAMQKKQEADELAVVSVMQAGHVLTEDNQFAQAATSYALAYQLLPDDDDRRGSISNLVAGSLRSNGEAIVHDHAVTKVDISRDGSRIAVGLSDGTVSVWRWPELTKVCDDLPGEFCTSVRFVDVSGRWLVYRDTAKGSLLLDTLTGTTKQPRVANANFGGVMSSGYGAVIWTGNDELKIESPATDRAVARLPYHVVNYVVSDNGRFLAAIDKSLELRIFDIEEWKVVHERQLRNQPELVFVSSDGKSVTCVEKHKNGETSLVSRQTSVDEGPIPFDWVSVLFEWGNVDDDAPERRSIQYVGNLIIHPKLYHSRNTYTEVRTARKTNGYPGTYYGPDVDLVAHSPATGIGFFRNSEEDIIRLIDATTAEPRGLIPNGDELTSMAYCESQSILATGSNDGLVRVLQLPQSVEAITKTPIRAEQTSATSALLESDQPMKMVLFEARERDVTSEMIATQGELVAVDGSTYVEVISNESRAAQIVIRSTRQPSSAVCELPSGWSLDGQFKLLSSESRSVLFHHENGELSAVFDPGGQNINVKCNMPSGKLVGNIATCRSTRQLAVCTYEPMRIARGTWINRVYIFEVGQDSLLLCQKLDLPENVHIEDFVFSRDGHWLVARAEETRVGVGVMEVIPHIVTINLKDDSVRTRARGEFRLVGCSPDGETVVINPNDETGGGYEEIDCRSLDVLMRFYERNVPMLAAGDGLYALRSNGDSAKVYEFARLDDTAVTVAAKVGYHRDRKGEIVKMQQADWLVQKAALAAH